MGSLTTWESHHSPRAKPEGEARGLWWVSQGVNEPTMPEIDVSISILLWWNKINDKSINTLRVKAPNCPKTLLVTCAHLGVRWPDCFSLVTRKPCYVTGRLVSLNSSYILHQNRQLNIHYQSWKTDQDWSNYFNKMIFENTNYLEGLNWLTVSTQMFCLILVTNILIHGWFLEHFISWV